MGSGFSIKGWKQELLKDFMGTVQTDLYAGYNPVLIPGEVTRLAGMAHV